MEEISPACTHSYIFHGGFSPAFQCNVISQETCGEQVALLNFYNLYFCMLGSNPYIFLAILICFVMIIFRYIGHAVEEYIAEGITEINKSLGLSESLAAVTLIAFAGGAGELITTMVAGDMEGGISYNIGHIFGSGLFIASVLLPLCGLVLKSDLVYSKTIIFRDVGFYLLTISVILAFALGGEITWVKSSILLGIYVLMVLATVFKDILTAHSEKKKEKLETIQEDAIKSGKKNLVGDEEENTGLVDQHDQEHGTGQKDVETDQTDGNVIGRYVTKDGVFKNFMDRQVEKDAGISERDSEESAVT